MFDLIGFGHCCADYLAIVRPFPAKGMKGDVVQSLVIGGGPVPTACQAVARFGNRVRLIGKIGDDADGQIVLEGLAACCVDQEKMIISSGIKTPRAYIWIDPDDGSRTVTLDMTGFNLPDEEELDVSLIRDCRMLLVDGRAADAAVKILHAARDVGAKTMLDAGAVRPRMLEILPLLDYAVVSKDFADTFQPGASPEELATSLIRAGVGTAIVTVGEKGAVWNNQRQYGFVPGFTVSPVVDTTGAGDVFHGGLIHGLLEGWDLERAIRFANAAGALSTRKLSGRMGIPSLSEVESLLRQ